MVLVFDSGYLKSHFDEIELLNLRRRGETNHDKGC